MLCLWLEMWCCRLVYFLISVFVLWGREIEFGRIVQVVVVMMTVKVKDQALFLLVLEQKWMVVLMLVQADNDV